MDVTWTWFSFMSYRSQTLGEVILRRNRKVSTATTSLSRELIAIILGPKILLKYRSMDKYQT